MLQREEKGRDERRRGRARREDMIKREERRSEWL